MTHIDRLRVSCRDRAVRFARGLATGPGDHWAEDKIRVRCESSACEFIRPRDESLVHHPAQREVRAHLISHPGLRSGQDIYTYLHSRICTHSAGCSSEMRIFWRPSTAHSKEPPVWTNMQQRLKSTHHSNHSGLPRALELLLKGETASRPGLRRDRCYISPWVITKFNRITEIHKYLS
jgi:hypothetical protein